LALYSKVEFFPLEWFFFLFHVVSLNSQILQHILVAADAKLALAPFSRKKFKIRAV
jgi:hypothetical protein